MQIINEHWRSDPGDVVRFRYKESEVWEGLRTNIARIRAFVEHQKKLAMECAVKAGADTSFERLLAYLESSDPNTYRLSFEAQMALYHTSVARTASMRLAVLERVLGRGSLYLAPRDSNGDVLLRYQDATVLVDPFSGEQYVKDVHVAPPSRPRGLSALPATPAIGSRHMGDTLFQPEDESEIALSKALETAVR